MICKNLQPVTIIKNLHETQTAVSLPLAKIQLFGFLLVTAIIKGKQVGQMKMGRMSHRCWNRLSWNPAEMMRQAPLLR